MVGGCDAANLLLEISADALVGCGFVYVSRLHNYKENRQIASYVEKLHNVLLSAEMDGKYYNLWSTDNDRTDANDEVVIKSVYDPSPVGYSLPASNAFTGFTTTGQNAGTGNTPGNPDEFNVKQPFDKGWYLYTNSSKTITTFYKRVGCREVNKGKVEQVNYTGHAWSVTVASGINSFHFGFSDRFILPLDNNAHGWAFAVRSAEEK